MSFVTGTHLGPYEILAQLGAGGMGVVFRARDARLGRDVAVKVLPERVARDPDLRERFRREARAVAALSHPNILAIHDVGQEGDDVYLVTELLEGETLSERLSAASLPARKAVDIAAQIAQGLAAAHEQGIVHRDLKPANVFLTRDGRVKILDFGLARIDGDDEEKTLPARTEPGTVLGTVGYMAPEQVRGVTADHRSDIFSLGVVLLEMLTGRRAFQRESAAETMTAILHEDPPDLSKIGRSSPELHDVVAHCLEKRPEERFQTAHDLAFALRILERDDRGGGSTPTARGFAQGAPATSIAVLPFRNLSPDPDNAYLSDGITEEIIGSLTRIDALSVASRTSSFAFRSKDEDIRRIGAQLGVKTVLEGSVQRAGARIRVGARLVDVNSGYQLWSERYDRLVNDVFELQDDIARAIAGALKVRLLGPEDAPLADPGTADVEAYNHFLKARFHFNRRDARSAVQDLEQALARDAGYVAAHTALADAYCVWGFYGGIDTRVAFARARSAAETAKALLPDAPEVHVSLALIEHYFGWDTPKLERECHAAIAADPRYAAAYSWLALNITFFGREAEAREHALHAVRLEPLSANFQTNVGWTYFAERDFPRALAEFRRALAIEPDAIYPRWATGMTHRVLGAHDEAIAAFESTAAASKRLSHHLGHLGAAYAGAGRREDALAVKAELDERERSEYVAPCHVLPLLVALGDVDGAFAALERACEERNALAWWPASNPLYDSLRSDPRFESYLSRIVAA